MITSLMLDPHVSLIMIDDVDENLAKCYKT